MAHDELIEQLRHPYAEIAGMVADEAADLIEQQAARIAKLEAALADGIAMACFYYDDPDGPLRTKLAAALEQEQ